MSRAEETEANLIELGGFDVLVHESSALVKRAGEVELGGTRAAFRVPVGTTIVDRTVVAEVEGARVVSTRVIRKPEDEAETREALTRARDDAAWRHRTAQETESYAGAVLRRAYEQVAAEAASGRSAEPSSAAEAWSEDIEKARQAEQAARHATEVAFLALREATEALEASSYGQKERFPAFVEIVVDTEKEAGAPAKLTLRYLVGGAAWRPTHSVRIGKDGETLVTTFAAVWQHTGEDWPEARISVSTERPSAGVNAPKLSPDRIAVRAEVQRQIVAWEDEVESDGSVQISELPGVGDGGETWAMSTEGTLTVPSNGQVHRGALTSFRATSTLDLVVMGGASYFRSTFTSGSDQALLAGPARLYLDGDATGTSRLPFTPAGGKVQLSLGSEDSLEVEYESRKEQDTTSRKHKVRHVHQWNLKNLGAEPIRAEVLSRIPVGTTESVTVVRLEESTKGAAPDKDGRVSWVVNLAPGEKAQITNAYGVVIDT